MTRAEPPPDGEQRLDEAVEEVEEHEAGVRLRDRQGLVLLLLLAVYLLSGWPSSWARQGASVIFIGVLLLALWVPGLPPLLRRVGAPIAGVSLLLVALLDAIGGNARGIAFLVLAGVEVLVLVAVLARIAQHSHVTRQTVMGALSAYVLIGFVAAGIYQGANILGDEPFFGKPVEAYDFLYFSFVTLTTTGYGDFTPVTALGKRMVVIEALLGQIFLLTLVARLVSMWGQPLGSFRRAASRNTGPGDPQPDR